MEFILGLWKKDPRLIDDTCTQRLGIQIVLLETAPSTCEAPQIGVGVKFRDPNAILLVAPVPGLGEPGFCHSKTLREVLLKENTQTCACCLALLALAEQLGISQSRGWYFPKCSSWLLGRAGRCLQEM